MKRAHLLTSMLLAVVLALGMAPSFALAAGAGQTSTSTSISTSTSTSTSTSASTSTSSSAGTSAQTSTGQTAAQTPSATTPDQTSQSAVVATTQSAASLATQATPSVSYQAHVQDIGWQSAVSDGAIAGTSGQSKRVEALKISLSGASGSITYQAHVQDIGWQSAVSDGAMAGTSGQSKRVEALKISLSGDVANSYDVYYRVHVENYGWLAWAKDGETAGTSGLCFRIEALQIQLVAKGAAAPDGTGSNALAYVSAATASYSAHVQNVGWQGAVSSGATAGTTGRGLRVEALKAQIASAPVSGGISYSAHVQDIGWQDFVSDGALAGTTGQSKRVEALKVSLTGDLANYFDVYYRVHIQDIGWLGWAENGEVSGSTGLAKRIEALQVKLVAKGGDAPGSTDNYCYTDTNIMGSAQRSAAQLASWYNDHYGSRYPSTVFGSGGAGDIYTFCTILAQEAAAEGVRSEVAFAQEVFETGGFGYGSQVAVGQFNMCGLKTSNGSSFASFPSVRIGIRAHIQHLKAYASTEPLNQACVDPRFNLITRGSGTTIDAMSNGWAPSADPRNNGYANQVTNTLKSIMSY